MNFSKKKKKKKSVIVFSSKAPVKDIYTKYRTNQVWAQGAQAPQILFFFFLVAILYFIFVIESPSKTLDLHFPQSV